MVRKIVLSVLFSIAILCMSIPLMSAAAEAAVPPFQTLTILGAQGTVGDSDPYTEFSLDEGQSWRRAYLYGYHPWGYVEGTNSWMNCAPSDSACVLRDVLYRVRFNLPNDFTSPQTLFQFKADNAVTVKLNSTFVADITAAGTVTGDTYMNGALLPGQNEILMTVHDSGGLAGMNYKVTIGVQASSPPTLVTAPLSVLPAPTFSSNPATPTKDSVSVTITYPADAAVKQYSFNETDWSTYTSPIVMTDPGTIYARWKDAAGAISSTGTLAVTNFDRTPPEAPTLIATPTEPTNGDVQVTVAYPGESTQNTYRIGTGEVQNYNGPVAVTVNGSVYAYAKDAAGNTSTGMITISNIDKTAPSTPSLTANITNPTNSRVLATITNWGDATVRQYRINGGEWKSAADGSAVIMTANGTVEARGQDAVGNWSATGNIQITNIVADANPVQAIAATLNADGTQITLKFNHRLNTSLLPKLDRFRLNGAAISISSAVFASDREVVLQLSAPYAAVSGTQPITLELDTGAVTNANGKSILEWKGIPVQSPLQVSQLRQTLLSLPVGSVDGSVRVDHVVNYITHSPMDITGDGRFDGTDVLWLLQQVDHAAPVGGD
ncbi:MAG: coagulation factor 5/8 type protein [Paenibacillus sp.]|nr:coagulation factor 5/8 type protein [Paenibacillus sp.]